MQLQVTVGMEINFHPGDQIPVLYCGEVVGKVEEVRATYVLDGQEYTQVTVEVMDDAVRIALSEHIDTQQPVFSIYFPRTPNDIDHIFKVANG